MEADILSYLKKVCQAWGGDLLTLSKEEWQACRSTLQEAPFTSRYLGLDWDTKTIVTSGEVAWVEVLHEMGHLFACHVPPMKSQEQNFFGWEYRMAAHLGMAEQWTHANSDYGVVDPLDGTSYDLSQVMPDRLQAVLDSYVASAQSQNLLDATLAPLSLTGQPLPCYTAC